MSTPTTETPRHDTVMDVTEEQLARVYAQAFLGVVSELPNVEALVAQLQSFVDDVLDPFPQFEEALRSALVSHEHKEHLLERVLAGRAAKEVLNFLKVLSAHGRLVLLRQVVRAVEKLYASRQGRTEVEVRVARQLDATLQDEIVTQLRTTLGTEPVLNVVVDPSLIAGIVIRVGDRVFDASVNTQFDIARRAIVERITDTIETNPERFLQTAS